MKHDFIKNQIYFLFSLKSLTIKRLFKVSEVTLEQHSLELISLTLNRYWSLGSPPRVLSVIYSRLFPVHVTTVGYHAVVFAEY